MATAKLDISRELNAVNRRDHNFYKNLTEEEQKAFSPYILMRYVSNPQTDPDTYEFVLERVNDLVNINHWTLSKGHKHLLWELFASCGVGVNLRYTYLKANTKEKAKTMSVDYFIFGHRHYAIDLKINEQSRYINLGDWIRLNTYAVFDGKDLQLLTWEAIK